jgi:hypothetical protein
MHFLWVALNVMIENISGYGDQPVLSSDGDRLFPALRVQSRETASRPPSLTVLRIRFARPH